MPIYEYKCSDCGNKFDSIRPMTDADKPINCLVCNSIHTSRTISVFFAQSGGRLLASQESQSCSSCAGGNCSACRG